MALPGSGPISMSQVRTELGLSGSISLGQSQVRTLAGVASGAISMSNLRGKSAYTAVTGVKYDDYVDVVTFNSPGTASANPSVVASNGTGSYTYAWTMTTANGCVLNSGTAASRVPTVTKSYTRYYTGQITCTLQCVISDGTTSVTLTGITVTFAFEGT